MSKERACTRNGVPSGVEPGTGAGLRNNVPSSLWSKTMRSPGRKFIAWAHGLGRVTAIDEWPAFSTRRSRFGAAHATEFP